jgi:hypothetical protein
MQKFLFQKREYDVKIGFWEAIEVFPEKFGIYLTKLLGDMEKTNETLTILLLDDEKMLSIMWWYLKEQTESLEYESFLQGLDTPSLASFREAFWEETLNFSGPLKEKSLKEMMRVYRKELKNLTLDDLDSRSLPEASHQTPSPSGS